MAVKGTYLLLAGGGAILVWSGLKGHRWTTTLRSVLSGQPVPSAQELAIVSSPAAFSSSGSQAGPLPATGVGGSHAKNVAIGRTLAATFGWGTGNEWSSLYTLWTGESGWDNRARNPSSGAYGIPQALPASKMGKLANPPISSATAQILWGLRYIKATYGTPSHALAMWNSRSPHWY